MISYDDSHSAKYDVKHTKTALQSYFNEEHLGTTVEPATKGAFSDGKAAQRGLLEGGVMAFRNKPMHVQQHG